MSTTFATNGHRNGHASDEQIDTLYSFWPGLEPAPAPCPEAAFSLTLKGKLDGIETLLTVRAMSAEEFYRNLQQVRGLLDAPAQPAAVQSTEPVPQCKYHGAMKASTRRPGTFFCPKKLHDGRYCQGK
jgi:hypothetical protein